MKKVLCLLLVTLLLTSTLVGCSGGNMFDIISGDDIGKLLETMSGSDVAKLLLANERLDAQLLKTEGDLFENGVEVMNNLAKTAMENLNVSYAGSRAPAVATLASVENTATVIENDYSGKLEIDGDTFTWSEFEENNNSYDAFKGITDSIVSSAKRAADLIDNIKKNVRVVDKWVDMDGIHYYLSVSENSELLCERDMTINEIKVCRRHRNADGKDVYELYTKNDGFEERTFYIPGERYEMSRIIDFSENRMEDYFVADSSKGYWETYVVGVAPEHYNVSYFIMKDDICYDTFYDPKDGSISMLKVMSADRATDILNFSDYNVSVKFSGFDGVQSVVAPADAVEYVEGEYANISQHEKAKVYLTNGKVLNCYDSFVDGNASILAIRVVCTGGFGYIGEIDLQLQGETKDEKLENLRSFLDEVGLKCKRDIDGVFNGIHRAYVELENITQYYTWNGISVIDEAGIAESINIERDRFDEMAVLYTNVKDVEVLDGSDADLLELNIKFAPVTQSNFDTVTLDAMKVSVGGISLTIEDTTLYVKDEPYHVALALADKKGGLIHFDVEGVSSTVYADEDIFTVTASAFECTLPVLSEGTYTFVAYIATSEGIRASAFTPVTVTEIKGMPYVAENISVSASRAEGDTLVLTCSQEKNFAVTITTEEKVGYEAFKAVIFEKVFAYGIPSDVIEQKTGDTYTPLTGNEAEMADGTYRVAYTMDNGGAQEQGYIYVQYACQ